MNVSTAKSEGQKWGSVLRLLAFLLVAAFAYAPGTGGSLHYDDPHNLSGLARVGDTASAVEFIVGGRAGPVGRALALASFVPQAYAWPHSPDVFLRTNIGIHLLNATLVAWMLYLLALASDARPAQAARTCVWAAGIWALLPILASASLMIVQRMTTLSATFVFAGIIAYLYSRTLLERRPSLALALMGLAITVGTTLAVLTKENGALLPVLILAAEVTILRPPSNCSKTPWNMWRVAFVVAPAAAILVYLALQVPYDDAMAARRGFSAAERLLTQSHILWDYVRFAFIPSTASLGPFHDHYPVYRDWLHPTSLLALAGWGSVIIAAAALRRRAALFSFALSWYLLGHALESTTLPLELYFEHRNYIPLVGPCYALAASVRHLPSRVRQAARYGLAAYVALLAIVLHSTTSLWGNPGLAGEMWAIYNPSSKRATQYLAQQLQGAGDHSAARRVLRKYQEGSLESAALELQSLGIACLLENQDHQLERIEHLRQFLPTARFEHGVFESLERLYRMAKEKVCDPVDQATVYELTMLAAQNPAFRSHGIVHHNLHVLMAEEAFARRDLDLTMHHLDEALASHYAFTTLVFAIQMLNSAGLHADAHEFLKDADAHTPRNPLRAALWNLQMRGLQHAMKQAHPL